MLGTSVLVILRVSNASMAIPVQKLRFYSEQKFYYKGRRLFYDFFIT